MLGGLAPAALGRELTRKELALFDKYLKILRKWQQAQRLVGSANPAWIQRELFADALIFTRFLPEGTRLLLDFGSGAGLPGLPLKIVRRELEVVLLESRAKRVSFLRAVVRELELAGIRVVGGRAEAASDLYSRFDVVTARCAGRLETMSPIASQFLRPEGLLLLSGPPSPPRRPDIEWRAVTVPGVGTRHIGIGRPVTSRQSGS